MVDPACTFGYWARTLRFPKSFLHPEGDWDFLFKIGIVEEKLIDNIRKLKIKEERVLKFLD